MAGEIIEDLKKAIVNYQREKVAILTKAAIEQGIAPKDVIQKALVPGIRIVGERFGRGEIFLPELLVAGRAMEQALNYVEPMLPPGESSNPKKFLIGTVRGDIHDIGKRIVVMMLKSTGWQVTDLGVDVSPDQFCSAAKEGAYDIVGLSTLITVTMPAAAATIEALKKDGLREKIKVMVGGAPVNQDFCEKIGADAFGTDAWEAVTKAQNLLEKAL